MLNLNIVKANIVKTMLNLKKDKENNMISIIFINKKYNG